MEQQQQQQSYEVNHVDVTDPFSDWFSLFDRPITDLDDDFPVSEQNLVQTENVENVEDRNEKTQLFDEYWRKNRAGNEYFAMIERIEPTEQQKRMLDTFGIEPQLQYDSLELMNQTDVNLVFLLRKVPYRMYSRLMQNTETGAFMVCNRMELELRLHNKNKFPIRVMFAVHNPHGASGGASDMVQSVYPQHSTVLTSLEEDFLRIMPGKTESIPIQASQFGRLSDGQHAQLLAIVLRDEEGLDFEQAVQRIRNLQFPLDTTSKYALCHPDVYISNFVFEKFTRINDRK